MSVSERATLIGEVRQRRAEAKARQAAGTARWGDGWTDQHIDALLAANDELRAANEGLSGICEDYERRFCVSAASKQAAEINAERIEAIIEAYWDANPRSAKMSPRSTFRSIARRIVEAIPELQPAQQRMDRGNVGGQTIARPLPWAEE